VSVDNLHPKSDVEVSQPHSGVEPLNVIVTTEVLFVTVGEEICNMFEAKENVSHTTRLPVPLVTTAVRVIEVEVDLSKVVDEVCSAKVGAGVGGAASITISMAAVAIMCSPVELTISQVIVVLATEFGVSPGEIVNNPEVEFIEIWSAYVCESVQLIDEYVEGEISGA
jgi:hypothetical protein